MFYNYANESGTDEFKRCKMLKMCYLVIFKRRNDVSPSISNQFVILFLIYIYIYLID